MDPARSSASQTWKPAADEVEAEAPTSTQLAVAEPVGDHTAVMEDVSTIPHGLDEPQGSARKDAHASASPRLRLAGTPAGPLTPQVRMLLELRSELTRALAVQEQEAGLIRARLDRNGRPDPIAVVTGTDAFTRSDRSMRQAVAEIDARLAHLDHRTAVVEIEPGVGELLDRR